MVGSKSTRYVALRFSRDFDTGIGRIALLRGSGTTASAGRWLTFVRRSSVSGAGARVSPRSLHQHSFVMLSLLFSHLAASFIPRAFASIRSDAKK